MNSDLGLISSKKPTAFEECPSSVGLIPFSIGLR